MTLEQMIKKWKNFNTILVNIKLSSHRIALFLAQYYFNTILVNIKH